MTMPVILFGGILTGIATPTEVSSFAVVYGLLITMLFYRVVDFRGLVRAALDSALLTGMICSFSAPPRPSRGPSPSQSFRSASSSSSRAWAAAAGRSFS